MGTTAHLPQPHPGQPHTGTTTRSDFTQFVKHPSTNGTCVISYVSYDRLYLADCIDGMGADYFASQNDDTPVGVECSLTRPAQDFANQLAS